VKVGCGTNVGVGGTGVGRAVAGEASGVGEARPGIGVGVRPMMPQPDKNVKHTRIHVARNIARIIALLGCLFQMVRDLGEDMQRRLWSVKQEDKFVKYCASEDDFLALIVANNDDARQAVCANVDVQKICIDVPALSP
jgi:hypothetical protein